MFAWLVDHFSISHLQLFWVRRVSALDNVESYWLFWVIWFTVAWLKFKVLQLVKRKQHKHVCTCFPFLPSCWNSVNRNPNLVRKSCTHYFLFVLFQAVQSINMSHDAANSQMDIKVTRLSNRVNFLVLCWLSLCGLFVKTKEKLCVKTCFMDHYSYLIEDPSGDTS